MEDWRTIRNLKCAIQKLVERIEVLENAGEGSGPIANILDDISEPYLSKADLAVASGITRNSVRLTDGTDGNIMAFRRIGDLTSIASSTIIIDQDDTRWQVGSIRDWLDAITENTASWS